MITAAKPSRLAVLTGMKVANYKLSGLMAIVKNQSSDADQFAKLEQSAREGRPPTEEESQLMAEMFSPATVHKQELQMSDKATPNNADHVMSITLAEEAVRKSRAAAEDINKLTEAVLDAKRAMEYAVAVWKPDAVKFMEESDRMLLDFRRTRMALDLEIKTIKTSVADILGILGDPSFAAKTAALKGFIESAERLKALKESGFLDAMMETLLKADTLTHA